MWKWSRDQDLRFEAARNLYAFMKIFDVLLSLKKLFFLLLRHVTQYNKYLRFQKNIDKR